MTTIYITLPTLVWSCIAMTIIVAFAQRVTETCKALNHRHNIITWDESTDSVGFKASNLDEIETGEMEGANESQLIWHEI